MLTPSLSVLIYICKQKGKPDDTQQKITKGMPQQLIDVDGFINSNSRTLRHRNVREIMMSRHMEIAKTIRGQLMTIDWAALMAWGAKDFSALEEVKGGIHPHLGGLHFKVNGLTFKGHIHITLNASDLYNIEGLTIRKKRNGEHYMVQRKRIFLVKDIFAEDLVNTLDSFIELGAKQEDFETPNISGVRGGRY